MRKPRTWNYCSWLIGPFTWDASSLQTERHPPRHRPSFDFKTPAPCRPFFFPIVSVRRLPLPRKCAASLRKDALSDGIVDPDDRGNRGILPLVKAVTLRRTPQSNSRIIVDHKSGTILVPYPLRTEISGESFSSTGQGEIELLAQPHVRLGSGSRSPHKRPVPRPRRRAATDPAQLGRPAPKRCRRGEPEVQRIGEVNRCDSARSD